MCVCVVSSFAGGEWFTVAAAAAVLPGVESVCCTFLDAVVALLCRGVMLLSSAARAPLQLRTCQRSAAHTRRWWATPGTHQLLQGWVKHQHMGCVSTAAVPGKAANRCMKASCG